MTEGHDEMRSEALLSWLPELDNVISEREFEVMITLLKSRGSWYINQCEVPLLSHPADVAVLTEACLRRWGVQKRFELFLDLMPTDFHGSRGLALVVSLMVGGSHTRAIQMLGLLAERTAKHSASIPLIKFVSNNWIIDAQGLYNRLAALRRSIKEIAKVRKEFAVRDAPMEKFFSMFFTNQRLMPFMSAYMTKALPAMSLMSLLILGLTSIRAERAPLIASMLDYLGAPGLHIPLFSLGIWMMGDRVETDPSAAKLFSDASAWLTTKCPSPCILRPVLRSTSEECDPDFYIAPTAAESSYDMNITDFKPTLEVVASVKLRKVTDETASTLWQRYKFRDLEPQVGVCPQEIWAQDDVRSSSSEAPMTPETTPTEEDFEDNDESDEGSEENEDDTDYDGNEATVSTTKTKASLSVRQANCNYERKGGDVDNYYDPEVMNLMKVIKLPPRQALKSVRGIKNRLGSRFLSASIVKRCGHGVGNTLSGRDQRIRRRRKALKDLLVSTECTKADKQALGIMLSALDEQESAPLTPE